MLEADRASDLLHKINGILRLNILCCLILFPSNSIFHSFPFGSNSKYTLETLSKPGSCGRARE